MTSASSRRSRSRSSSPTATSRSWSRASGGAGSPAFERAGRIPDGRRGRGPGQAGGCREPQGLHGQGARPLRAVRQAVPPPRLRGPGGVAQDRRPGAVRRHALRAPGRAHRREAGAPGGGVPVRASPEAPGPAGGRDRQGQHRPPDQQQGQEADGEGPEGVLPQREDQGDPPGARDGRTTGPTRSRT